MCEDKEALHDATRKVSLLWFRRCDTVDYPPVSMLKTIGVDNATGLSNIGTHTETGVDPDCIEDNAWSISEFF